MLFYETFILLFAFLLLNIPIFLSLYKHVMKDLNPFAKVTACVLYWFLAFLTQELIPFIGVIILLFRVHGKAEDEIQMRDINIWSIGSIDIALVAGAALVFKIVISQLNRLYVNIIDKYLGMDAKPQEIVEEFAAGELYYKLLLFALVVVLAPFVEEYIFRYYIYDKLLLPRMPAVAAAIISSALFTLLHFNASGIPTFLGLGLYCAFVYEKKGFYGAVITHVVSNLVTAAFLM
ncbi:MAG: CPBP family glutamic-type intramembrane protease [Clostridia bacterium]